VALDTEIAQPRNKPSGIDLPGWNAALRAIAAFSGNRTWSRSPPRSQIIAPLIDMTCPEI
jgi:hypothetical protein